MENFTNPPQKIVAILQARASSSRLPNKVLLPILGEPMLARQIERIQRSSRVHQIILATSTDPSDQPIEALANSLGIHCYRGNLNDVLDRFYQAAQIFKPDYIVRLTGDCPLIDPGIIDQTISHCMDQDYDYVSCALEPTFPDGLDTEVFRFSCLEKAWQQATLTSEREHVTPFIYSHPEKFKIGSYKNTVNLSDLRWTVDEPKDFELITQIYSALYPKNPDFRMAEILSFLEKNPALKTWNTQFKRNEGYEKSISNDSIFKSKGK